MLLFVLRYRRRPGHEPQPSPHHSLGLELTWTIIPLVLVVIIFVVGFRGYMDMVTPPANAYQIMVIGQKWSWAFQYPNGYVDANLHVPVDRPIELILSSRDVIHSDSSGLSAQEGRRSGPLQPGWFQATKINTARVRPVLRRVLRTSHSPARHVLCRADGLRPLVEQPRTGRAHDPGERRAEKQLYSSAAARSDTLTGAASIGPSLKSLGRTVTGGRLRRGGRWPRRWGRTSPPSSTSPVDFRAERQAVAGFAGHASYLGQ